MGAVGSLHELSSRPHLGHPWWKAAASPARPHLLLCDSHETKLKTLGMARR